MAALENAGGNTDGVIGTTTSHDVSGVVGLNFDASPKNVAKLTGYGVAGATLVPDGAGVFGTHLGLGIGTGGLGLIGVWGGSESGVGVLGISEPAGGKGGDGVQGITNSEARNGVYGRNNSTDQRGTTSPTGNGVLGYSSVPDGAGVMGVGGGEATGVSGASAGHGVMGNGAFGVTGMGSTIGVWGIGQERGFAGYFSGSFLVTGPSLFQQEVSVSSTLFATNANGECVHAETESDANAVVAIQNNPNADAAAFYAKHEGDNRTAAYFDGNVVVTGDIVLTNGADCAEDFDVVDASIAEPGSVMVLGTDGRLDTCSSSYDKRVVGVVSGAGSFRPGVTLDRRNNRGGRTSIALIGKAYCKVDAQYGSIAIGDLLTTSPTKGHAMRAGCVAEAFGAVIGKAMQALPDGRGLISVVIALQ